jgi:hypothetical protein
MTSMTGVALFARRIGLPRQGFGFLDFFQKVQNPKLAGRLPVRFRAANADSNLSTAILSQTSFEHEKVGPLREAHNPKIKMLS